MPGMESDKAAVTAATEGTLALRPQKMLITVPEEADNMLVSEDQIEMLRRGGRDASLDLCLALGGVAFGFAQNALAVVSRMWSSLAPSKIDIVLSFVCFACAAAAIAKYTEYRRNRADIDALILRLKSGRKVIV